MVGTGWNVGSPVPEESPSLSGSVVQYMYQLRDSSARPRMTVGSAQLSTVPALLPPGGIPRASGLWYEPGGGAAWLAAAAETGRSAAATSRVSKRGSARVMAARCPRLYNVARPS